MAWAERQPRASKRRLATASALSLVAHGFVLLIQFGEPGEGWPFFEVPWGERRAFSVDEDRVGTPAETASATEASVALPPSDNRATPLAALPGLTVRLIPRPAVPPAVVRTPGRVVQKIARAPRPKAKPAPEILALAEPNPETFVVPPAPSAPENSVAETARIDTPEERPDLLAAQAAKAAEETARLEQQAREQQTREQLAREQQAREEQRRAEEQRLAQQRAEEARQAQLRAEETRLAQVRAQQQQEAQRRAEEAVLAQRRAEEELRAQKRAEEELRAQKRAEEIGRAHV